MPNDPPATQHRFGLPTLYLAIFLLALTGLYAKLIPLDAASIIQLRAVVATVGLALFGFFRKRSLQLGNLRSYLGVYTLGLLLGIHWVTFFHAMQVSSIAVGMLAMFSFPIMTVLLEPLFTGQGWHLRDLIAGLITLAGLALMVLQGHGKVSDAILAGVFWGILSAVLFSLRNLFQKYRFPQFSSDSLMFHQVIAVGVILLLFVDYLRVLTMGSLDFLKIILLGLFSTAGAHTLLVYSLKQLPAKSVALISCLQPVIATFLAWIVVQEVPGTMVVLGGLIVLSVSIYESLPKKLAVRVKASEDTI